MANYLFGPGPTVWQRPVPPYRLNTASYLARDLVSLTDERLGYDLVRSAFGTFTGTTLRADGSSARLSQMRGYGSTLGAGTTDRLVTTLTTHATQRTYAIWVNRNGDGGSSVGRLFDKNTAGTQVELMYRNTISQYEYYREWSTGDGAWTIPQPNTGIWTLIAVSYDSGSTSNNPEIYLNGIAQSVTERLTPSGTLLTNADTYVIGNRGSDSARVWDGLIGPFMVWNRILSAGEHWSLYDLAYRWDLYETPSRRLYVDLAIAAGANTWPGYYSAPAYGWF